MSPTCPTHPTRGPAVALPSRHVAIERPIGLVARIGSLFVATLFVAASAVPAVDEGEAADLTPRLEAGVAAAAREVGRTAAETSDPFAFVAGLTTEVGARPAGSAADGLAVGWAERRLRALGLEHVWTEEVEVPHWVRGEERGQIVAPWPQRVVLAALGGSIGTPDGGLEAEVVEVTDLAELDAVDDARVAGRIVYVSGRMARSHYGETYGPAVRKRRDGASRAAEKGAVALLIRSVGTSGHRFAHTGSLRYDEAVRPIPAAALSAPDADLLSAQILRAHSAGESVRFRLELGSRSLPPATSANVLAEIRGRERPDEIVLLAAHLDSWDLGTGAMDDGSGCAIVAATLASLGRQPQPPRRTVRILLAANEEFGLSGAFAYAERHRDELDRHVAALEADFGIGPIVAFRANVAQRDELVADLAELLAPLGIPFQPVPAFGGADLRPLAPARVPLFDLPMDAERYFDLHHTADDTLDKLDPAALRDAVGAYATLVWALAESEQDLGRTAAPGGDEGEDENDGTEEEPAAVHAEPDAADGGSAEQATPEDGARPL